jgi:hypothetical protein
MRRVRLAWVGVLALSAGLLIAPPARAVDPKLLPADTEWVFSFNLKQILDSDLVKANRESLDQLLALAKANAPEDPGAEKFMKAAGFDMMRDMISLTVAGPAGVDPDKLVVIVEGKFDANKVHTAADDAAKQAGEAVRLTKIGAVKVYEIGIPGEKTLFASLVDDKHLVVSVTRDMLAEVVARNSGAKKATLKKEFKTVLDATNAKQSLNFAATGAALTTGVKAAPKAPKGVGEFLEKINGVSGAVTVKKDIEFQLNVAATNGETAQQIVQGGEIALGAAKLMVNQKAEADPKAKIAADVLNTFRVTSMGNNVVFRGELSVDVIERIFKMIGM